MFWREDIFLLFIFTINNKILNQEELVMLKSVFRYSGKTEGHSRLEPVDDCEIIVDRNFVTSVNFSENLVLCPYSPWTYSVSLRDVQDIMLVPVLAVASSMTLRYVKVFSVSAHICFLLFHAFELYFKYISAHIFFHLFHAFEICSWYISVHIFLQSVPCLWDMLRVY